MWKTKSTHLVCPFIEHHHPPPPIVFTHPVGLVKRAFAVFWLQFCYKGMLVRMRMFVRVFIICSNICVCFCYFSDLRLVLVALFVFYSLYSLNILTLIYLLSTPVCVYLLLRVLITSLENLLIRIYSQIMKWAVRAVWGAHVNFFFLFSWH